MDIKVEIPEEIEDIDTFTDLFIDYALDITKMVQSHPEEERGFYLEVVKEIIEDFEKIAKKIFDSKAVKDNTQYIEEPEDKINDKAVSLSRDQEKAKMIQDIIDQLKESYQTIDQNEVKFDKTCEAIKKIDKENKKLKEENLESDN